MHETLRAELLAMIDADDRIRSELAADGTLHEAPYHPRMEEIHRMHAARLEKILDSHGWPGRSLVGTDGAEAAWRILQHAIGDPGLQRSALPLLWEAAASGEAEARHAAYLEDRIAFYEGRPQRYGTQCDWQPSGALGPWDIEDLDSVDARRAQVNLPPLREHIRSIRERAAADGERAPNDLAQYRARQHAWAVAVGWRPADSAGDAGVP